MEIPSEKRLMIVSNRLPITVVQDGEAWQVRPSSGGLVTAMAPVLRGRGGMWIGWTEAPPGVDVEALAAQHEKASGYRLAPVALSGQDVDLFYHGFSNEVVWPLFHSLQTVCNFNPDYWESYLKVNRKFADRIISLNAGNHYIWVHDYHLMHVGKFLKEGGLEGPVGFFLHIPFPGPDTFLKLPWRREILDALLDCDLIGFQTLQNRRNFIQCVRTVFKDVAVGGKGQVLTLRVGERTLRVGNFPIGIDYQSFVSQAASPEVTDRAWEVHQLLPERQLILGVDRLDYTKGIPYRLDGFRRALKDYPELRGQVTFIQVVVPSREDTPAYSALKMEIEGLVGEINGEYTVPGWVPIHYQFRHLTRTELLAYYRTCEIALITPLEDGMNLVCKEYCAANLEETGVLILSEFAGAAPQMQKGAILVNPYDRDGLAQAIRQALGMPQEERKARMRKLRRQVQERSIFWWVDTFLRAGFARNLAAFPQLEEEDSLPEWRYDG
ncbi:MAG: trehalose-6-phosphate synthase [Deltaproteobacteria bacterium]|nr:trehalose-6-phosphate synthase [Deltaproteobacteria bacterium]